MAASDKATIARLQRALIKAGAAPAFGTLAVTGALDDSTVRAVANWARKYKPALVADGTVPSKARIALLLDGLVVEVERSGPSMTGSRPPTPQAKLRPTPTLKKAPEGPTAAGPFDCKAGVCRPTSKEADRGVRSLQKLLLGLEPVHGVPIGTPDGVIGPKTAGAVAALRAKYMASGGGGPIAVPSSYSGRTSAEDVAADVPGLIAEVTQYANLYTKQAAPDEPKLIVAPADLAKAGTKLAFKLNAAGSATGNDEWTCWCMALQVQLNRLGQRLGVDGTLGKNTLASLNATLKKIAAEGRGIALNEKIGIVAGDIKGYVALVKDYADKIKAPKPDPAAGAKADVRCKLRTYQPIVDRRYFTDESLLAVPQQPPPVKRTPTDEQPPIIAPSPKAQQVQALLNAMPAPVIARYPGGKPVPVTGLIGEADAAAMREVMRAMFTIQGRDPGAALAQTTPSLIANGLDQTITFLREWQPKLSAYYAVPAPGPAAGPVVVAPGDEFGTSRGGLQFRQAPGGRMIGVGPRAAEFARLVVEIRVAIAKFKEAGSQALAGIDTGIDLGRARGAQRAKQATRVRVPAGIATKGGAAPVGEIDAGLVADFNSYVVPTIITTGEPGPWSAVDIAMNIEDAAAKANQSAGRLIVQRPRPGQVYQPPPPPPRPAPGAPDWRPDYPGVATDGPGSWGTFGQGGGAAPKTDAGLVAEAQAAGLPFEEAAAVVEAGHAGGQSQAQIEEWLQQAVASQIAAQQPAESSLSTWAKIGLGVAAGAVVVAGIALLSRGRGRGYEPSRLGPSGGMRLLPAHSEAWPS